MTPITATSHISPQPKTHPRLHPTWSQSATPRRQTKNPSPAKNNRPSISPSPILTPVPNLLSGTMKKVSRPQKNPIVANLNSTSGSGPPAKRRRIDSNIAPKYGCDGRDYKHNNATHREECCLLYDIQDKMTMCPNCKYCFHKSCMRPLNEHFKDVLVCKHCRAQLTKELPSFRFLCRTSMLTLNLHITTIFSLNHIFLISNFVRVGGQLNTPPVLFFIYSTSTPITTISH